MSVQCICLLCAMKVNFPDSFYLLRGNHECMNITQVYGFEQEILVRYRSESIYHWFESLFNALPICAIIGSKVFCVHGGISEGAPTIDIIENFNRFQEIPSSGPIADLLWSDPLNDNSKYSESERSAGHKYGEAATSDFLRQNNLSIIVRAHQVITEGAEYCQHDKVLTVYSAPNYEPSTGNKAAILVVNENMEQNIHRFKQAPPRISQSELLAQFVY